MSLMPNKKKKKIELVLLFKEFHIFKQYFLNLFLISSKQIKTQKIFIIFLKQFETQKQMFNFLSGIFS